MNDPFLFVSPIRLLLLFLSAVVIFSKTFDFTDWKWRMKGIEPGSNEVLGLCAPLIHFQILIWIAWNDPRYTTRPRRRRLNDVESVVFFFLLLFLPARASRLEPPTAIWKRTIAWILFIITCICVCVTLELAATGVNYLETHTCDQAAPKPYCYSSNSSKEIDFYLIKLGLLSQT